MLASVGKSAATVPATLLSGCALYGEWREGRIIEWVWQINRDGWEVVILTDGPPSGPPWQGRYLFDPQSIRPRHTDQPPGDT